MILTNFYKGELFVLSFAILLVCECSEIPRPRGVSIAKAPLYAPGKDFTCFDGSLTIPFEQVNDDYCDCNDGSDEPGTAACLNGIFHCTNAGHKPLDIPSSRVNDGICDCCDASDEYSHPSSKCVNNCGEMGREARLEALRKAELLKAGSQLRTEIIQKGSVMKQEMQEKIQELEKNKQEAELLKEEKNRIKDEIEAQEKEALKQYQEAEELERKYREMEESDENSKEAKEIFQKFDSDKNGLLCISEIQTRSTFDKDRNGEVSEEEAKFFLAENAEIGLDDFIEKAWPLVKPYLMVERGLFKPPVTSHEVSEEPEEQSHEEQDIEEPEDTSEQHEDFGEDDADADGYEDGDEFVPEKDAVDKVASNDDHPEPPPYDEETQRLVNIATEARGKFAEAERAVRDIENEIHRIKESLEKDYGPQEEFATLAGECLEYTDREYLYKLCPFDKATQQPKNGGSETRLGNWGEWVGDPQRYSAMLYSQGTACWNGPNRSARINIHCGLETAVYSVSEPNRCEYVFEMRTPAACIDDNSDNSQRSGHDEL